MKIKNIKNKRMINQGYYLLCFISALLSIYNAISPVQGASSSSNPNSHDEVQRAILEDFFQAVPVSDACTSKVAVGSVVPTEISFNHTDPSSSNFSPQNLPYEKDLFLVEMFYPSVDNLNNTWRLRLGSGGNVYSFYGRYGEVIPPNIRPEAPFMDEVWQNVAVDHSQHNPAAGKNYFIHQAGAYFRRNEIQRPFFSPTLAVSCQNATGTNGLCMVASYGTQAHIPTTFASSVIYFTRYINCGNGVIEVTSMLYNHAKHFVRNHTLDHMNIPWGGVRTSTLPDMLVTKPDDLSSLENLKPLPTFGAVLSLPDTGGYTVFVTSERKDDKFSLPFVMKEEQVDKQQDDHATSKSTTNLSTDQCSSIDANATATCSKSSDATCHSTSNSSRVVTTQTKVKVPLKLVVAEGGAIKRSSQVISLPLAPTVSILEGYQLPLTFINGRTRKSIEVASVEHWNNEGIWFRTKATVDEINSAFAVGDEIIVEKRERLGLAYIHGRNPRSLIKYGVAGNPARDYTVFTVIVKDKVNPGEMIYKRQYVITGSVYDIKSKSALLMNDVSQKKNTAEEVKSMPSRSIFFFTTDFSTFGLSLDSSCNADSSQQVCVGSTTPTNAHDSMLFVVECGTKHYVGHDVYRLSPKRKTDTDFMRLHVCDDMPGVFPKYTFLGFVAEDSCKKLENSTFDKNYGKVTSGYATKNLPSAKDEL